MSFDAYYAEHFGPFGAQATITLPVETHRAQLAHAHAAGEWARQESDFPCLLDALDVAREEAALAAAAADVHAEEAAVAQRELQGTLADLVAAKSAYGWLDEAIREALDVLTGQTIHKGMAAAGRVAAMLTAALAREDGDGR